MHLEHNCPFIRGGINNRDAETPCLLLVLKSIPPHAKKAFLQIKCDTDGDDRKKKCKGKKKESKRL